MKIPNIFTRTFFLKSVFVISSFLLLFLTSISYNHTKNLAETSELLEHSYKIQIQLEQLSNYLEAAETAQRGFIISHDTTFLPPYISGLKKVNESYLLLKSLTMGDIKQQNNLDSLHKLVIERFSFLANSLKIVSLPWLNKTMLDESMFIGKQIMVIIRLQINKITDLEMFHLKEHQKKYNRQISFTPLVSLFLLLFSLSVFIGSYIKINNDFMVLKQTYEKLLIKTESIKHAEIIGDFCISQWDMETNKLSYSDNLYSLLGCDPQSFEPTIGNYLEFVHPEDRQIVIEGTENTIQEITNPRLYRVIRKDGEIRYFKSMGKFLTGIDGNKIYIQVIKDITQYQLSSNALEEKNHELQQIIKELESFNHVASHDLQEPMRKILTFISRIFEKEALTLSETGKGYFAKIQASANFMRTLIDDLLLFSRTNKTEKVFKKTDFNLLLESVRQDLAQDIEEKNAVIQSVQLPVIDVISFQIHQLFTNLIGNSLKYSKPGISPVINIECEKILAKDYPILKTSTEKKYFKISVEDNGLGFDQEHAESIFILFKRLHNNKEYHGTGIGLSICKKIVENHNGLILAQGKPDIGSIFTFFLPA